MLELAVFRVLFAFPVVRAVTPICCHDFYFCTCTCSTYRLNLLILFDISELWSLIKSVFGVDVKPRTRLVLM